MKKQQKPEKPLKAKIKSLFTFLCASQQPKLYKKTSRNKSSNKKLSLNQKHKQQESILKKSIRQRLSLSDTFIKISRKNIMEQQFTKHMIFNYQIQRHIGIRVHGTIISALLYGQFTRQTMKSITYPIILTHQSQYQIMNQGKQHLMVSRKQIWNNFRPNSIDLILYQTRATYYLGIKAKSPKKLKKQQQQQQHNNQLEQIKQLFSLQASNNKQPISNIILIFSNTIDQQQLNQILAKYTSNYIFELQRIKQNQQLSCYVLYASDCLDGILKISRIGFREFMREELGVNQKEKYNKAQRESQSLNCTLSPIIQSPNNINITPSNNKNLNKSQLINNFFDELLQLKIELKIIKIIKQLKKSYLSSSSSIMMSNNNEKYKSTIKKQYRNCTSNIGAITKKDYLEQFIGKIGGQQNQQIKQIVNKYQYRILGEQLQMMTSKTPSLYNPTPQFGQQLQSMNYY